MWSCRARATVLSTTLAIAIGACGDGGTMMPPVLPPDGISCGTHTTVVGDAAELQAALAVAVDGECILATAGTYDGTFEMSIEGVTVAAVRGDAVTLSGGGTVTTVVRMIAERTTLAALTVSGGMRNGIFASAPGVTVDRVQVIDSGDIGVAIKCEDQGCLTPTGHLELAHVTVERARTGFYLGGARVTLTGGGAREVTSTGIGGGVGLFILDGAVAEVSGVTLENNIYGAVIDGAGTTAVLQDVVVRDNEDVGVWAQGLRGSVAAPALEIRGSATRISGNSITGAGATNSTGLVINGGEITQTKKKVVPINVGDTAEIGDGVGLFDSSGEVLVRGVNLSGNQRAQAVVDGVGLGVQFDPANIVTAGVDQYEVVVQNTLALVEVPPGDLSAAPLLPVRSLTVSAPPAP